MDIRIRFSKFGPVKYIGHLDLMRYFQKALRRSDLPITYTKGFSPHPVMSFAAPLGVGITSEGEYMDISLEEEIEVEKIRDILNAQMAYGIEIISVAKRSSNKKAMAELAAASYIVFFKRINGDIRIDKDLISDQIDKRISNASSLVVTKETKKSSRQVDLIPLIYQISCLDCFPVDKRDHYLPDWEHNGFLLGEEDPAVYMKVSARSSDNLRPELLMKTLLQPYADEEAYIPGIHRLDMFREDQGGLVSFGEGDLSNG